jgi:hypothetical protein
MLEERVFGKDLKNKNITFRGKKEKYELGGEKDLKDQKDNKDHKDIKDNKQQSTITIGNTGYYNVLKNSTLINNNINNPEGHAQKRKFQKIVTKDTDGDKIIKHQNHSQISDPSLLTIDIPLVKPNNKPALGNLVHNQNNFIKIGNNFYRTSMNAKKQAKPSNDEERFADSHIEKCEYARRHNPQYTVDYAYSIFEFLKKTEVEYKLYKKFNFRI